jgi:HK97 family phage prohead protease
MSNDLFKDLTFTVYSSTFEKSTKDGRRLIRGYASTSGLDLEREIISRKALEKAKNDLLKNHTVFIEHNHSPLMACGKVVDCILDDKGLLITVELSKAKFVDDIFILCEENILNSFSIGGIVIDGHDERGEDGKSYHVIDEILILEVSIVGIPCNQEAKFSVCKSFNSAIAEQIKQKEESQKMAKQDKQEVLKSEAPNASLEATQEPIQVEEPKEQAAPEVVEKEVVVEAPKEETPLEASVEKTVEVVKEEVIEAPKPAEVALEAPKEEIKKEVIVEEPPKVDETPSEENPNPGLVVEDTEKADWTVEYINTLPNSSFAVIEPAYLDGKTEDKNCRHLPFKDENGEVDLPHYRNALARCNQIKPVTDSISEADLRSQAATELEKYRDLLEENKSEKSTEEKILDALALIIEKLSSLDKKEVTEKKEEVVEPKKEEKSQEVTTEKTVEETIVEKKEEIKEEEKVEKTLEKVEEVPTRKSLAIVVPAPYEEEETETNPKEDERKKSLGWGKLIFGK